MNNSQFFLVWETLTPLTEECYEVILPGGEIVKTKRDKSVLYEISGPRVFRPDGKITIRPIRIDE